MQCMWNNGGKAWNYEYKYRCGGKRYVRCMRKKTI